MYSTTANFHPCLQDVPVCVHSFERRQQRRVGIQHFTTPLVHKPPGQNSHEASQADELHVRFLQSCVERQVKIRARGEIFVIYYLQGQQKQPGYRVALTVWCAFTS